jgi:hypothetical protein
LVRIGPRHNSEASAERQPDGLPSRIIYLNPCMGSAAQNLVNTMISPAFPFGVRAPGRATKISTLAPFKSHLTPVPALSTQLLWLVILAIPVASIAWTVTHEDVLKEIREYCKDRSVSAPVFWQRKFFYLFTCEYCFSHYVTVIFLGITHFKLLYPDWRGYLVSLFATVWMANLYMNIFAHLRLDIHHERIDLKSKDLDLQSKQQERRSKRAA